MPCIYSKMSVHPTPHVQNKKQWRDQAQYTHSVYRWVFAVSFIRIILYIRSEASLCCRAESQYVTIKLPPYWSIQGNVGVMIHAFSYFKAKWKWGTISLCIIHCMYSRLGRLCWNILHTQKHCQINFSFDIIS